MTEVSQPPAERKDFKTLRQSGRRQSIGRWIGGGFVWARDGIARGLVAIGATPNAVTVAGFLMTCGAGVCFAFGAGHVLPGSGAPESLSRSWWPLAGAAFIYMSAAGDMLDGAVARVGKLSSSFGAVFDSTLDRLSDVAIFAGCAAYFASIGNVTLVLMAFSATGAALLTSYVKARSENVIDACGVGFWQRGERVAAVLIAACCGHLPTMLWLLGTTPWMTVMLRVRHARDVLNTDRPWQPAVGLRRWMIWRDPRGSFGYDVFTGLNIAFLIVGPWIWPFLYATTDPIGNLLRPAGS